MGRQLSEDDIVDIASSEGIPGYQLLAIANKENSNDESVSGAGARGRFQLLPATFQSVYPEGDINNPRDNAIASARYLKQGIDANGGDFTKGAMYYYAGPSFSKKIEKAPGAKYGTNPDGTGGISIEDYGNQATRNANKYAGNNQTVTDADGDNDVSQPDADGDDLNSQIAKLSLAANTQLDKMQGSSAALSERLKANIQKQMDAVTQGGDLESTIFLDKYKQTTTQAAETATELSRLSINESDLDSTIAQISVGLNERYREAQQLRQQIRDKQSVGILDDPVGWLTNKLTINSDIRKHNAIIEDMNAQKEYVDQATSIADRAHAVNAAKFVAISNEGAQASAQLLRNKAQIEAVKLEDTMLKTDFETQARTLSLLGTRISLLDRLENSQDRQKLRKTQAELSAQKLEQQQNDDMAVRVAGNVLGVDIPDRKSLDKKPKDLKDAVNYIMANGGVIGKDPLEAFQVLKRGNPQAMAVTTQQQMGILNTAYGQAVNALSRAPEMQGATREKQAEFIKRQMQITVDQAADDPNYTGLKNNPYKIPSIDTMQQVPEVMNSRMVPLIKNFQKQFPDRDLSDTQLAQLVKANVGPTKVYSSIQDAAKDLSNYYKAGVKFNNDKMRFSSFGMKDQETYRVNTDGGKVDLTSYASIMQSYLAQDRNAKFLGRLPGVN